ncbi:hypothetical protein COLO4_31761 [Corchorus olitorius]|uniref:Uncharacterized protein n=1 Tax=Corchorus olitorius TaxID=93759 RepID=A0A1R3H3E0_9ROSI|nr:hypothetical protein COLO4_31761 [Corchorus olitorius]
MLAHQPKKAGLIPEKIKIKIRMYLYSSLALMIRASKINSSVDKGGQYQ